MRHPALLTLCVCVLWSYSQPAFAVKKKESDPRRASSKLSDDQLKQVNVALERVSGERRVRQEVSVTLREIGPAAASPLGAALKAPDAQRRRKAAVCLGLMMEMAAPVAPALIEALKDADKDVREDVAYALEGHKSAIPALIGALSDPIDDVRRAATRVLGRMAPDAAFKPLTETLKDEHWTVRKAAGIALARWGKPEGRAAVEARLKLEEDKRVKEAWSRALAPR